MCTFPILFSGSSGSKKQWRICFHFFQKRLIIQIYKGKDYFFVAVLYSFGSYYLAYEY